MKFEMSLYVFAFVYEASFQKLLFLALFEFIQLLVVFMAKISFTSCKDPVFRMSLD